MSEHLRFAVGPVSRDAVGTSSLPGFLQSLFAIVSVALLLGVNSAKAQSVAGLLFYSASSIVCPAPNNCSAIAGEGATATLDDKGNYRFVGPLHGLRPSACGNECQSQRSPFFGTVWTHIIGTPGGNVLFYNTMTGEAATATLNDKGNDSNEDQLFGGPACWPCRACTIFAGMDPYCVRPNK